MAPVAPTQLTTTLGVRFGTVMLIAGESLAPKVPSPP
jgi:hypothetical protein